MDNKSLISCLMILMMFYSVSSDFAQDKEDCQEQLVSLSPCLNFVTGDAKSPAPTCCAELKKDVTISQSCLCILVKDQNEPGLGFKLNATLALSLIPICHVPSNATFCTRLLHLSPNSTEAQLFEQFDNTFGVGNGTSAGAVVTEITTSSSAKLSIVRLKQAAIIRVLILVQLYVPISSI